MLPRHPLPTLYDLVLHHGNVCGRATECEAAHFQHQPSSLTGGGVVRSHGGTLTQGLADSTVTEDRRC